MVKVAKKVRKALSVEIDDSMLNAYHRVRDRAEGGSS